MKKSILMSLALLGAFVASADSYLYWMVDNSGSAKSDYSFAYAVLNGTDAGGSTQKIAINPSYNPEGYEGGPVYGVDSVGSGFKTDAIWTANLGDTAYTSFFVELYNDSDQLLGTSSPLSSYESYIKQSVTSMTAGTAYTFSTFSVPEPTSGLMLLFGIGLLGLKRKKA